MNSNSAPRPLPPFELSVFVAVAEAQGFSAAARRLGVSKAMVSTAVNRLEERLGVRLLQRTTRKLSLTEGGAAVLPHAQRSLQAALDAEDAASHARSSPRGVLRVSAPMSFGLLHVVPAVGDFMRAYPDLTIDLVLDDRYVDLVEGAFDLAVRIGALADSSLVAHRIGLSRMALVASPAYVARAGHPKEPSDLARHSTLVYTLAATWTFRRGKRTETVRPKGRLRANSSLALQGALAQGLGIARMPLFAVGPDLAKGRLVRVLPKWELPESPINVVTTARDWLPRKTHAFIEFLRGRFGSPPYWEK